MVFLAHRKLLAKGFLSDLIPWCFIPIGNYSHIVSYAAWLHCISYRQETFCEGFPVRLGSMAFLTHRKLFAYGFLSALAPCCFLPTGNCSRRVSYSAWLHGVLYRQETVGERFPVRLDSTVFLTHRKLFAKGFPFDLAPWRFFPTGNYSRRVSCPTWLHGFPYRQETFCLWFPVRLDSMVFHTDRKLFAYGFLSGLAPWYSLPTGNCSPGDFSTPLEMTKGLGSKVFLTDRKLFAKGFLFGLAPWCSLPTGNFSLPLLPL